MTKFKMCATSEWDCLVIITFRKKKWEQLLLVWICCFLFPCMLFKNPSLLCTRE